MKISDVKEKLQNSSLYAAGGASCAIGLALCGMSVAGAFGELFVVPMVLGGLSFFGIGVNALCDAYQINQEDREQRFRAASYANQRSRALTRAPVKTVSKSAEVTENREGKMLSRSFGGKATKKNNGGKSMTPDPRRGGRV